MAHLKEVLVGTAVAALTNILGLGSASAGVLLEAGGWRISGPPQTETSNEVDVVLDFVSIQGDILVIEKVALFRQINELVPIPDSIVLSFTQIAPDAQTVSRIVIADETVANQTGLDWVAFEFILSAFGYAEFNQTLSAGFDIAPFTNRTYNGDSTVLTVDGGTIADGQVWTPGQLAGNLVIDVDLSSEYPVFFTFKELPLIPTPGSVALLGVAGLAVGSRRRRG